MEEFKYVDVKSIELEASPGATIADCIFSGIIISARERVPVNVLHNDRLYKIIPDNLFSSVIQKVICPPQTH